MVIKGDDVPKVCAGCSESCWEEMYGGYEDAFCSRYNELCKNALRVCDRIVMCACKDCPRWS